MAGEDEYHAGRACVDMDTAVENLLRTLQFLPFLNDKWSKLDISLSSNASDEQYKNVKKQIRSFIPKGSGGLYVIGKSDNVFYMGESEKNIRGRLIRHIDKIYVRKDYRSRFFKQKEYQGDITIYYWTLPLELIGKRKTIEALLTMALKPEYQKWNLKNQMIALESAFKDNEELDKGKARDEDVMRKELEAPRIYWEKFVELNCDYSRSGLLTVNIDADNPADLEENDAMLFASKIADRKGYPTFDCVEDDIRLYGQNSLAQRKFFFTK